jgi:hypothetical protein
MKLPAMNDLCPVNLKANVIQESYIEMEFDS